MVSKYVRKARGTFNFPKSKSKPSSSKKSSSENEPKKSTLTSKQKQILEKSGVAKAEWEKAIWVSPKEYKKATEIKKRGGTSVIQDGKVREKGEVVKEIVSKTYKPLIRKAQQREAERKSL